MERFHSPITIESILLRAEKNGQKIPRWQWPELKSYNGFSHDCRVRKWQAVLLAIEMGLIPSPTEFKCDICGVGYAGAELQYHSEDYSRMSGHHPLCKNCHRVLHQRFRKPDEWGELIKDRLNCGMWFNKLPYNPSEICIQKTGEGAMQQNTSGAIADVQRLISPLGFGTFQQVTNRASISDKFGTAPVPGLYVLAFCDGAYYAGKTNDFKQRFRAHQRNHGDIDYIAIKNLPVHLQDHEERPLVEMLKSAGILLRNIQFISNPDIPREFDEMISGEQQKSWIEAGLCSDQSNRQINDEQRYRYSKKFRKLENESIYQELRNFLWHYTQVGLISPKMTEMSYWCISVWPSPSSYVGHKTNREYCRLNIGGCEVMTIGKDWVFDGNFEKFFCVFHTAKSPLVEKAIGGSNSNLSLPTGKILSHKYENMGEDQISIAAFSFDDAKTLINDPQVQKAIRVGNLGLMRKRSCLYSQNHCYDLADQMIAE